MIYGYILIMVIMLPSGDIDSRAVDWFEDPYECVEMAQYQHENNPSPLGIGFTCIEDLYGTLTDKLFRELYLPRKVIRNPYRQAV